MAYPEETATPEVISLKTILSVLVLGNIVGNTLVILTILKNRSMKTPINYLLLNLAVADLMVGGFALPSKLIDQSFRHPAGLGGDLLCIFLTNSTLLWIGQLASTFSLVGIAVERYHAVTEPLNFQRKLTISGVKILLATCWIASAIVNLPDLTMKSYHPEDSLCYVAWPRPWQARAYASVWFGLAGVLPTAVMASLYGRIARSLWFGRGRGNLDDRSAVLKSRKKVSQMMLIVTLLYFVSCLPCHVYYIVAANSVEKCSNWVKAVIDCLIAFNSAVNPFVYSLQSERFQNSVRRLFRGSRRSQKHESSPRTKIRAQVWTPSTFGVDGGSEHGNAAAKSIRK